MPNLAPQRGRSPELDTHDEPRLRAPSRLEHRAQDAVDPEPGVPEVGVLSDGVDRSLRFICADDSLMCTRSRPRIIALHLMEPVLVQWLIQLRLVDGRLPRGHPTNLREHPGDGQSYCHGCSTLLSKAEKIVVGMVPDDAREFRLHRDCFRTWETECLNGHEYRW